MFSYQQFAAGFAAADRSQPGTVDEAAPKQGGIISQHHLRHRGLPVKLVQVSATVFRVSCSHRELAIRDLIAFTGKGYPCEVCNVKLGCFTVTCQFDSM